MREGDVSATHIDCIWERSTEGEQPIRVYLLGEGEGKERDGRREGEGENKGKMEGREEDRRGGREEGGREEGKGRSVKGGEGRRRETAEVVRERWKG